MSNTDPIKQRIDDFVIPTYLPDTCETDECVYEDITFLQVATLQKNMKNKNNTY